MARPMPKVVLRNAPKALEKGLHGAGLLGLERLSFLTPFLRLAVRVFRKSLTSRAGLRLPSKRFLTRLGRWRVAI